MTLYRIYAGRLGIDYHETSRELGFVEAESDGLALEYARTLKAFLKPNNGYDTTSSSEGKLEVLEPFVATLSSLAERKKALHRAAQLEEFKARALAELERVEAELKGLKL